MLPVGVSPIPVFPSKVNPDALSVTEEPIDTIRPVWVTDATICVISFPLSYETLLFQDLQSNPLEI